MTAAVIWLVVWFILAWVGPGVIAWSLSAFGLLASSRQDTGFGGAVLGWIVGIVLALAWFIFAAIQVVLQVVDIISLL